MWKLLHRITPNNVDVQFKQKKRFGWNAVAPMWENHVREASRNLYENYFDVSGPRLGNTLPDPLNTIQTKNTIKYWVTEFETKLPDEPPVRNYARAHKNTLHDVLRRSPVEEILRRGSPVQQIA